MFILIDLVAQRFQPRGSSFDINLILVAKPDRGEGGNTGSVGEKYLWNIVVEQILEGKRVSIRVSYNLDISTPQNEMVKI